MYKMNSFIFFCFILSYFDTKLSAVMLTPLIHCYLGVRVNLVLIATKNYDLQETVLKFPS